MYRTCGCFCDLPVAPGKGGLRVTLPRGGGGRGEACRAGGGSGLGRGAEWAIKLVDTATGEELALRGGGGSLWSSLIRGGDIFVGVPMGDILGDTYVCPRGDLCPEQ